MLEEYNSMEDSYVNQVVETTEKLTQDSTSMKNGSLFLTDLSEKFSPMIMAIEHSGMPFITADYIKTKLMNMENQSRQRFYKDHKSEHIRSDYVWIPKK